MKLTRQKRTTPKRIGFLADRAASSWVVVVISYPLFLLDQLGMFGLSFPSQDTPATQFISSLLLQVGILVFMQLAHFSWLRTDFARRHPSLTLVTMLFAVLFGHTALALLQRLAGINVNAMLSFEEVMYQTAILIVMASAVVSLSQLRVRETELRTFTRTLTETREQGLTMLHEVRTQVVEAVISALERAFATAPDQQDTLSKRLRSVANEDVRGLSHSLAFQPRTLQTENIHPTKVSWRDTWSVAGVVPQLAPKLLGWVMVILLFRLTIVTDVPDELASETLTVTVDLPGLLISVTGLVAIWCITYGSAKLGQVTLRKAEARGVAMPRFWLHFAVVLGVGVIATLVAAAIWILLFGGVPVTNTLALFSFIGPILLLSFIVGSVRAARDRITESVDRHDELATELRWDVSEINLSAFNEQQVLARLLHGPVQSVINSAAKQLESAFVADTAMQAGAVTSESLVASSEVAKARIRQVLEELDAEYHAMPIRRGVDRLVELWHGACEITLDMSDEVAVSIDADSNCSAGIIEVLTEACSNAHKHGGASEVHVTVTQPESRLIRLEISNDGELVKRKQLQPGQGGYGTQLLNQFTVSWRWAGVKPATLVADLPLSITSQTVDERSGAASSL